MGGEATRSYPAEDVSVSDARRFVAAVLADWGFDEELVDDAALCTAELVTNAILHAATPIDLTVERCGPAAARVDVRDRSVRPVAAAAPGGPRLGAPNLDGERMSGRGLLVVEHVAAAWGVTYGDGEKTVWFTVGAEAPAVRDVAPPPRQEATDLKVRLIGVPVRISVASANSVDDVLREFQLLALDEGRARGIPATFVADVEDALRRTAPGRLASREAAAEALERGDDRYDLVVRTGPQGGEQLDRLNALLEAVAARCDEGTLLCLAPPDEVTRFRRWCASEVHSQLSGAPPRPCPFSA